MLNILEILRQILLITALLITPAVTDKATEEQEVEPEPEPVCTDAAGKPILCPEP